MNNQIDAKEIQNSIDEVSDIMETVVAEKCENIVKYFTSDLDAIMDAINNDVKDGITDGLGQDGMLTLNITAGVVVVFNLWYFPERWVKG